MEKTGNYFVYILECVSGTYYTGFTNDLERRIKMHACGKGAKYTRGRGPFNLVYVRRFRSLHKAMSTEKTIQNLPKKEKMILVKNYLKKHPAA